MELAVNLFNKGLLMDTNPMVQGNDSLSDALNATFMTMNGNEVILLNDMGNRRVDGAFLPPGYQPVGMKEYGGIIYVASYNPITNRSQIGSFPSPERNILPNEIEGFKEINIDLIYTENTKVSNCFYTKNEDGISFLVNNSFLIPITDDTSLHTGDKFTIYSEQLYSIKNSITNFNNIAEEKVKSPKNKKYTLSIGVVNSLNEFVDITNSLVRWDENGEIIDTSNDSDLIKFNRGYFIAPFTEDLETSINNKEFIENRQTSALNTYAFKLISPLYLKVTLNTIQNFTYDLYSYKDSENVYINITANIEYNCPDGVLELTGELNRLGYYTLSEGKIGSNFQGFNLYILNNNNEYIEKSEEEDEDNNFFTTYDSNTNLYQTKITKRYKFNVNEIGSLKEISYYICVSDNSGYYLKELSKKGKLDLNLIGSGTFSIDEWNYNWEFGNLNYGLNFYPQEGEIYKNLYLHYNRYPSEETNQDIINHSGVTYYKNPLFNDLPLGYTILETSINEITYYTYKVLAYNINNEYPERVNFYGRIYYRDFEPKENAYRIIVEIGENNWTIYQSNDTFKSLDKILLIEGEFKGSIYRSYSKIKELLNPNCMYICSLSFTSESNGEPTIKSIGNIEIGEDYNPEKLWIMTTKFFDTWKDKNFSKIENVSVNHDFNIQAKVDEKDITYNTYEKISYVGQSSEISKFDLSNNITCNIPILKIYNTSTILKDIPAEVAELNPGDITLNIDLTTPTINIETESSLLGNITNLTLDVEGEIDFTLEELESESELKLKLMASFNLLGLFSASNQKVVIRNYLTNAKDALINLFENQLKAPQAEIEFFLNPSKFGAEKSNNLLSPDLKLLEPKDTIVVEYLEFTNDRKLNLTSVNNWDPKFGKERIIFAGLGQDYSYVEDPTDPNNLSELDSLGRRVVKVWIKYRTEEGLSKWALFYMDPLLNNSKAISFENLIHHIKYPEAEGEINDNFYLDAYAPVLNLGLDIQNLRSKLNILEKAKNYYGKFDNNIHEINAWAIDKNDYYYIQELKILVTLNYTFDIGETDIDNKLINDNENEHIIPRFELAPNSNSSGEILFLLNSNNLKNNTFDDDIDEILANNSYINYWVEEGSLLSNHLSDINDSTKTLFKINGNGEIVESFNSKYLYNDGIESEGYWPSLPITTENVDHLYFLYLQDQNYRGQNLPLLDLTGCPKINL